MRKLIVALSVIAALLIAVPVSALAATPLLRNASLQGKVTEPENIALGVAPPIYKVASMSFRPPGFTADAAQAVAAAEKNRQMLAIHAKQHPLHVIPTFWVARRWMIQFVYHGKQIAEVDVSRVGRVTGVWTGPLVTALYARGNYATPFGVWWVLVPFSLLFLLPFLDIRRLWRIVHLDALVLLSFLISYLLFDHTKLVAAVWMVYPPLLYLLGRMLWIGFGCGWRRPRSAGAGTTVSRSSGLSPLLSVRVLAIGLGALLIARTVLSLTDSTVIDVGYASVIGAHQLAIGHSLYFASAAHGDTYGPIAYLAYLPFELLFPWHGTWDYLPSAHAASLAFDLITVLGLVLLGRRLRPGREGLRLGLALGWVWAACPFTLLDLMMHSNDGLIAMLSVLSLLAFTSPAARGALLGLAAAAKFAPAAMIGLYAGDRRGGRRSVIICVVSFAAVVLTSIGLYLPSGGIHEFYEQTIGFQLTRTDVFSPWALHPGLDPIKTAVEIVALLLCAVVTFVPRQRSLVQTAALAGGITIAVQLPAVHWFYYYIVWFMPFVMVALLAGGDSQAAPAPAPVSETLDARPAPAHLPAPVSVGV
jgi:hypothetical protein